MSEYPCVPNVKDEVAPEPAYCRHRRRRNRDPDGTLLGANDATRAVGESSDKAVTQAETEDPPPPPPNNNNDVLDRGGIVGINPLTVNTLQTSPSSSSAAQIPLAFAVVAAADNPSGDSNESNVVINDNNINNNRNDTAAPSQIDHDHHQKSFPWNTAIVAGAVVVIVIAGIVVGGVCGSGGCGGTGHGDNPAPPTTMTPTTLSPVKSPLTPPTEGPGPTPAPSLVVTPQPTESIVTTSPLRATTLSPVEAPVTPPSEGPAPTPVSSPVVTTSNRPQDITNFINSKSHIDVDLSPTGTSPEERALQWLIHDDPSKLNVGAQADEFRLLQRYSLLTLWFQADTGTTWTSSTNWLTADECAWYGVICQSGVVTEVRLGKNGLQGSLSPDLGLLTDLTVLDLSWNSLSGSLPSEIGLWTNLEWFHVGSNNLTGSLPSEIGLWTNLEFFYVGGNALAGSLPSEIGLWTNLEWFDVTNNALTGTIPATIANWKLIWLAWFYDNNFSGSMPNGICEFITTGADSLKADCGEVTCSCCTPCE